MGRDFESLGLFADNPTNHAHRILVRKRLCYRLCLPFAASTQVPEYYCRASTNTRRPLLNWLIRHKSLSFDESTFDSNTLRYQ
jgi:hypothetical protein